MIPMFHLYFNRSSADYSELFTTIQDHLGDLTIQEIVMDFEAPPWKAVREEYMDFICILFYMYFITFHNSKLEKVF